MNFDFDEYKIDPYKVPMKYMLGIISATPTPEEALYYLVSKLLVDQPDGGRFNSRDYKNWVPFLLTDHPLNDVSILIELGYVKMVEKRQYVLLHHPWQPSPSTDKIIDITI